MTARSDLVAFFHEDARTEPTWLAELVPVFNDKAVFGAGSAIELSCGEPPKFFYLSRDTTAQQKQRIANNA
jgi:cellulose synthase/poly-beta-1,6-N-acetylglucosamine synthase-like glycosyltransferase